MPDSKEQVAAAGSHSKQGNVDLAHVNDILIEGIKREEKFHRVYYDYKVSPSLKKNFVMSVKPCSVSKADEREDDEYNKFTERMVKSPREKFTLPQTSSQEYGWDTKPLVPTVRDSRFHHPKVSCDITKFMAMANLGAASEKAKAKAGK